MIKVNPGELRTNDRIRFAPSGRVHALVSKPELVENDPELVQLTTDRAVAAVPAGCVVYAETMFRVAQVPCLVGQHMVYLLHDRATSAPPRGALCGDCDEQVTAQVLEDMARLKAERDDG